MQVDQALEGDLDSDGVTALNPSLPNLICLSPAPSPFIDPSLVPPLSTLPHHVPPLLQWASQHLPAHMGSSSLLQSGLWLLCIKLHQWNAYYAGADF